MRRTVIEMTEEQAAAQVRKHPATVQNEDELDAAIDLLFEMVLCGVTSDLQTIHSDD